MSAAPQPRPSIDLEEFERRLRAPEVKPAAADPLAELARLVGGQHQPANDPLAAFFAETAQAAKSKAVDNNGLEGADHRIEPGFEHHDHADAHIPELRGAYAPDHVAAQAEGAYPPVGEYQQWEEQSAQATALPPPPARPKKLLYLTAAVIAAGFIGISGSLAWRSNAGLSGDVRTIKASSEPVKVAPAQTQSADSPSRDSALLDRSAAAPPVRQVITRAETPVDPEQAAREAAKTEAAKTTAAAPVVPPPPFAAPEAPKNPPSSIASMVEPKRVKTVAVRADGSIVSSESKPEAKETKPAAKTTATPAAKNATPKSPARVAATPKSDDDEADGAKTKTPAKPQQAAKPQQVSKPAKPAANDDEEDAKPVVASSGGYALQLAAAGSAEEAKATAARLGSKFSAQLGGRKPSYFKAPDKDVYRIRVGGLSKEAADAACAKVKSAGGGCFVARN